MVSIGSDLSTRFLELPEELLQQTSEPQLSAQFQPELSPIFRDAEILPLSDALSIQLITKNPSTKGT
jgi:hypothetical protein